MNTRILPLVALIISISASLLFSSAKLGKSASLEIKIMDCRSQRTTHLSNLTILKNGKIIEELKPGHEYLQKVTGLELGTYDLAYTSIFNKPETLKVNITSYKKYPVELCVNYLTVPFGPFAPVIDRLQEKESYSIVVSSLGCFHFTNDTLTISRNNNVFTAKMGLKTKTLTQENIKAVKQFEFELNSISGHFGCTTTDSYTIIYNEEKKHVDDDGCSWNGDYYLKQNLFGKQ